MHVRQRLSVLAPRIHQCRDQVVGRMLLSRFDLVGEIGDHFADCSHHRGVIMKAEFEHFVNPLDEEIAVFFGTPSMLVTARVGIYFV